MRLWTFRRQPAVDVPPSEDVLITEDLLRRNVEDVFAVRERHVEGGLITFRGELTTGPDRALDLIEHRFRSFGYTPVMRRDGNGTVVLQAWPEELRVERRRLRLNVLLFVLTCVSTLLAGSLWYTGSPFFDALRASDLWWFLAGVPFAGTLMAILGVHEFGHYFTARYHKASVSLPYFIPLPFSPLGTLGAIIRLRSHPKDRNALFDIAVAGPVAGLVVALAAMLVGLAWSRVVPQPAEPYTIFGEGLLLRWLVYLRFGAIPDGYMLYTHPMADAAWAGFLVTGLNLLPVGQLDGGRISYALFGRRHRGIGRAAAIALVVMGLLVWTFTGALSRAMTWFIWAALMVFVIGFRHSPPLDDLTPLTPWRRALGLVCLGLLLVLIPPVIV